jgi:hypothetical protein
LQQCRLCGCSCLWWHLLVSAMHANVYAAMLPYSMHYPSVAQKTLLPPIQHQSWP